MHRRSIRSSASIFHDTASTNTTYTDVFCGSSMRPLHETTHTVTFRLHGSEDTIDQWPKETDALCWHCRHSFDGPPASIPMLYDFPNKTWHMKGVFCSFSCAKRHVLDMNLFNVSSVLFSMKRVASLFGVHDRIVAAPPLYTLKAFGGHLEIDEFRQQASPVFGCEYPFFNYGMGVAMTNDMQLTGLRRQPPLPKRTLKSNAEKTSMYQNFLQAKPKRKRRTPPSSSGTMGIFMKPKKKKKTKPNREI